MKEHSPLPWFYEHERGIVWNQDRITVCNMPTYRAIALHDGEFIVEACNSYESNQTRIKELEEALRDLLDDTESKNNYNVCEMVSEMIKKINKLLTP